MGMMFLVALLFGIPSVAIALILQGWFAEHSLVARTLISGLIPSSSFYVLSVFSMWQESRMPIEDFIAAASNWGSLVGLGNFLLVAVVNIVMAYGSAQLLRRQQSRAD